VRADLLQSVARDLLKYKLDFVEVPEVRWDEYGISPTDDVTFFNKKYIRN
jgi:hypothetical protein